MLLQRECLGAKMKNKMYMKFCILSIFIILLVGTATGVGIAAGSPLWGFFLLIGSRFLSGNLDVYKRGEESIK